jgi:hypothetical protein
MSSPAPTVGLWVRISLKAWMSVYVYSVCMKHLVCTCVNNYIHGSGAQLSNYIQLVHCSRSLYQWKMWTGVDLFFFNGSSSPFRALPLIQFRNHFPKMAGLFGRVISSSQDLYLNTGQHKHRINAYTHKTSIP